MEAEVELIVAGALLVFLATVLLIADNGLQLAGGQIEGVVAHGLVVLDLLKRQALAIGLAVPSVGMLQCAGLLIALALNDAGSLVEGAEHQVGEAPAAIEAHHGAGSPLAKL